MAKDLPPPVEGDEVCVKPIVLGKAAGTKVSSARGLMKYHRDEILTGLGMLRRSRRDLNGETLCAY